MTSFRIYCSKHWQSPKPYSTMNVLRLEVLKTQSFLVRLQFLYTPENTELTNLRRREVFKMTGSLRRHLMGLL